MLPTSVLLLCAAALAQTPQEVAVPAFDLPARTRDDFRAWARAHVPVAHEMPWLQRPWHDDLAHGVEQAWRESRPLALWLGDGHPFGAASAAALQLKPHWSDDAVRRASRAFVLVAENGNELNAVRAAAPALAAWLTRLTGDAPLPTDCVLFAAPDGTLLGRATPRDAAELAAACAEAEAVWNATHAARFPPPSPPERPGPLPPFARLADLFPHDGLALEIVQRRCDDPAAGPPEWLATGWNRDWLWIRSETLQPLLSRGGGIGKTIAWPDAPVRELARLLLVDSSLGRVPPFADGEILLAELRAEPQAVRRGLRGYQLTGTWVAQRGGEWKAEDAHPLAAGTWLSATPSALRARARVTGLMEVDPAAGRVVSLQLAALVQSVDAHGVRHHLALARRLDPLEDAARLSPSVASAAAPAPGASPRRYRALHAGATPQIDGSLAEQTWLGTPWTGEFGGGARAKWIWNHEGLLLGVWSPRPDLAIRAQGHTFEVGADGVVHGAESVRAAVRVHDGAWVFELSLPWSALAAERAAPPPPAGSELALDLRAGGADAAWWSDRDGAGPARVLLLPSGAMNLTPGGIR